LDSTTTSTELGRASPSTPIASCTSRERSIQDAVKERFLAGYLQEGVAIGVASELARSRCRPDSTPPTSTEAGRRSLGDAVRRRGASRRHRDHRRPVLRDRRARGLPGPRTPRRSCALERPGSSGRRARWIREPLRVDPGLAGLDRRKLVVHPIRARRPASPVGSRSPCRVTTILRPRPRRRSPCRGGSAGVGQRLVDRETRHRVDAARHPEIVGTVTAADRIAPNRMAVTGDIVSWRSALGGG
jgi:hypothetical protein